MEEVVKTDWNWLLDDVEGASLVALVEQASAKLQIRRTVELALASECMADAVVDLGIPIETLVAGCDLILKKRAASKKKTSELEGA